MTERTRSWWGWGWADQAVDDAGCVRLAAALPRPDGGAIRPMPVPDAAAVDLPAPAITPPDALAVRCSAAGPVRAAHAYGQAYRDVVRALRGQIDHPPDLVAYPRTEADITDLLDWAGPAGIAVIPYGGGTSVVGGVEYRGGANRGVVSLDLSRLDQIAEIDPVNRLVRVAAGVPGPALEDRLRPYGLSLRHFPQSFEFSTVGGWLATRSAGHHATLGTHIDDAVAALRVVTPVGVSTSWPLPASGAGPSPDRLFLGSEGILGVISEAWLRVRPRPLHRTATAVRFAAFADGVAAARTIAQSGLYPANCRLLDPAEARFGGADPEGHTVLLLGFESGVDSARDPAVAALAAAVDLARAQRGLVIPRGGGAADPVAAWRASFLRMPYLRDALARMSVVVETFETACSWDALLDVYADVGGELGAVAARACGAPAEVTCRLTHVYPDGAAPYFTVLCATVPGREVAAWDEIKQAAGEIVQRHGGSVTHHHAVGRDHRGGYDRQRPEVFATALAAAKRALDPYGVLNPGVLIDV